MGQVIYVAYICYRDEGNGDPLYVGFNLEKAKVSLSGVDRYDQGWIECWRNEECIECIDIEKLP